MNGQTDEREVLVDLVSLQPAMFHHPGGLILVVDKGYRDRDTETWLNDIGNTVVPPAYRTEAPRPCRGLLRATRQSIESVNETLKSQLHLEQHGGRTITGVAVRVLQRVRALTAATWHNWHADQPIMRSLICPRHVDANIGPCRPNSDPERQPTGSGWLRHRRWPSTVSRVLIDRTSDNRGFHRGELVARAVSRSPRRRWWVWTGSGDVALRGMPNIWPCRRRSPRPCSLPRRLLRLQTFAEPRSPYRSCGQEYGRQVHASLTPRAQSLED